MPTTTKFYVIMKNIRICKIIVHADLKICILSGEVKYFNSTQWTAYQPRHLLLGKIYTCSLSNDVVYVLKALELQTHSHICINTTGIKCSFD